MANEAHVKMSTLGPDAWNIWRRELGESSGIDLSGAELSGVDLSGADLNGVYLRGANLTDANLTGAKLRHADLSRSCLRNASLKYADLSGANLTNCDIRGVDLTEAVLNETIVAAVDLGDTSGLDSCIHLGPSTIDHRTLQRSGQIPISFLRGVGLPENISEYLPTLFDRPVQYFSLFLSYSTLDQDFAERIYADLQKVGVRCWFAPQDLQIGSKIVDEISAAIRLRDKVLLILSEQSVRSLWIEREVEAALDEERIRGKTVLLPIRLDDSVMESQHGWASKLRTRQMADFRNWKDYTNYKRAFARLARDLAISASIESKGR